MKSRERVLDALNHRETDRVPVDLSGHRSSGIAAIAYARLREHLGLEKRPIRVYDPVQQLAIVDEDVLDRCGPIFDAALWVKPVDERPDHLKAVGMDPDDTMLVRVAEAVYVVAPDIAVAPHKYIVSANTKHFPPGADYAGYRFETPDGLLKALE